jgi:microcystin-dependent protein
MPFDGSGNYTRSNGSYSGTTLWQQKAASASKTIDAAEHDAEMNDVATALSSCITKTGLTLPTSNLPMNNFKHTGVANATNPDEYATYSQLTAAVPSGSILDWPSSSVPTGWLLCDGSAVSRATYSALFAVIGTLHGAGDGSTTFNLPDCRGKFTLGKSAAGTGSTLGGTGGTLDHVHTLTHTHTMPAHYHAMGTGADLNITTSGSVGSNSSATGVTINSTNTDHTHSGTVDASGTHDHQTYSMGGNHIRPYNGINQDVLGGGTNGTFTAATRTSSDGSHTHTFTTGPVSTTATHTHGVTDAGHTHTIPGHTHASGNIAGRIGLVTGGVDGNATMTSGAASTATTTASNPAFIALNKIIKY